MMSSRLLLLINLGSPDSPRVADVRRYLREFLGDPRVIDIPAVFRWVILNLFILPFRPKYSSEAYEKIWLPEGSPLVVHTKRLASKLQAKVGNKIQISYAMRYQNPSIEGAISQSLGDEIDELLVLPLFPQAASATTGSIIQKVFEVVPATSQKQDIKILKEFYDHSAFIKVFSDIGRETLEGFKYDKILFSFHGLPERQLLKADDSENRVCLKSEGCCDKITADNSKCYRAQCFETARLIASSLGLPATMWEVAFQSRLGRDPWIKPYSETRFQKLPSEGVKNLAVFSPSFVADCLETLEEIEIRARETFLVNGGEDFLLVPSLNSDDRWVDALAEIISQS